MVALYPRPWAVWSNFGWCSCSVSCRNTPLWLHHDELSAFKLHCATSWWQALRSAVTMVQVPVLYPVRSSGGLKSQPSLVNQQSALFNNPASKGKLFFPSRPKDTAPAAATPVIPSQAPAQTKPPLTSSQSYAVEKATSRREERSRAPGGNSAGGGNSAAVSSAVDLIVGRKRQRRTQDGEAEDGGHMVRQRSQLPPQHRTEVYMALVVQVAVVADGGVSSLWCRSLKVAQGVLARAVFRKALELYECGTRPHHLQPLLRMQHAQRQKRAADPS